MILWLLAGVLAVVLLMALHLRRNAIRQGGQRVGSAVGWIMTPDGGHAHFAIVRGEVAFQDNQVFEYKGQTFLIVGYEGVDTRSTVLRRFLDVTCWLV